MKPAPAAAALAAALLCQSHAFAALAYSGGAYAQSFDTLPVTGTATIASRGPLDLSSNSTTSGVGALAASGLNGWYIANPSGTSTSTEFRAQNGSLSGSAGRGAVSFGTTDSTDRALGTLATSNQVNSFGLVLTNNTAEPLSAFTLSFTGEQWRRGDPAVHNILAFDFALTANPADNITSALAFTPVPQLTFASPNLLDAVADTNKALDGNLPANQTSLSYTITGLTWNPNEVLILRWRGQDLTGQDDGLAIDNLAFSAAVPEPASLTLLALAATPRLTRRRK